MPLAQLTSGGEICLLGAVQPLTAEFVGIAVASSWGAADL